VRPGPAQIDDLRASRNSRIVLHSWSSGDDSLAFDDYHDIVLHYI
jgi:hypothetical protein